MTISHSEISTVGNIDLINAAWAEHIMREERRGAGEKRRYLYASQRRRCLRRSVLEATMPEAFPEFDVETKARMARGKQRERDIMIDLIRVGRACQPRFEVIGTQEKIRITDRRGRLVISGKIDGRLQWADGQTWPVELKSWSPFLTDRINCFADLYSNHWTWSGAHQLLSYLYATGQPYGLLILDRPGLPRLIQVSLEENLEQMESFLADAESCVNCIEAETLPDFINDTEECQRCPVYGSACNPPLKHRGAEVLADPELELSLERREELKEAAKEFEGLDRAVKDRLRGVEKGIVGRFLLEGKYGKLTHWEPPPEIKKQYEKVDPHGRFTLTITRL